MNRTLLLGLTGLAAAAGIGIHVANNASPRYTPRHEKGEGAYYRGAFEWLRMMRANVETGQIEPGDHERMAKAVAAFNRNQPKVAAYNWVEMGPDNIGGRVRAICVDPNNSQKLWAGSVTGGLFRSVDGANTWQRIPAFSHNLAISSIAILGNGHLYVATGCSWESLGGSGGSGAVGDGLFMSADDGASFTHVLDASGPWDSSEEWAVINRIKADPTNPSRLYIAAQEPGARLYDESTGTVSLVLPSGSPSNQSAYDVDVSDNGSTVLFSLSSGDVWIGRDNLGTMTYTKLDGTSDGIGFPQTQLGRVEMALSQENPNFMYCLAATGNGRMSGAWSSTDRGATWNRIWPSNISDTDPNAVPELDIFRDNQQGAYDNAICVRPGHPDEVWVGGVELWKTSLNGQPNQLASASSDPGCFFCVHADVHEIVFADNATAYIGCDGGVYKSPNAGFNFFAANRGLSITQFYSLAYNAKGQVAGGTQDNGSLFMSGRGNTGLEGSFLTGGDGFDADLALMDTNIMFTSIYGGEIFRSNDQGSNFGTFYDESVPVDEDAELGVGLGDFYTNFRLYEDYNDENSPWTVRKIFGIGGGDTIFPGESRVVAYRGNINSVEQYGTYVNEGSEPIIGPWSDTLTFPDKVTCNFAVGFTGTQGVWVTRDAMNFSLDPNDNNGIPKWAKVVANAGGNVTCLEWSANGDALFWGTSEGEVYRVTGFNGAYNRDQLSVDSSGFALSSRQTVFSSGGVITGLAPDPSNVDRLVITLGGYGGSGKVRLSNNALDASPTFENIWNVDGTLTGMPCFDAVIHKDNGNIILVGTDFGVWATDDAGQTWTNQTEGIQGVPTFAMRQQTWNWETNPWGPDYITNPNVIYAGTHGRGMFRTESLVGIRPIGASDNAALDNLELMPNPATTQSLVRFELRDAGDVQVNIYGLDGKRVQQVARKNMAATVQNILLDVADLGTGTYIVEVVSGKTRRTARLVVTH